MADIIQLLPDAIANQIAAGEVIQRPASVVKELLENAIDAGSSEIRLIVKNAGKTLIQVIDNGCGMSETDARMCFERHATSKIRKTDDLFAIRTMGFRGEAMASIAAIAHVELKTKKRSEALGTRIIIEGSEIQQQEACQFNGGTSIAVKNLFYNVPARRNFLKSNSVEMRHIIDEFQRVAIANPDLFFSLHHNDQEVYHLPSGNLRQRIVKVFGNNTNKKLVPIQEETDVVKITGYIGKPEFAKKTRGQQFFFVNNRFIKSSYLNHAIVSAYDNLLPKNTYPLYIIFLDVSPSNIDINVHPTKQEIKFEDEKLIYQYLTVAVRHALGQYSITPVLDFTTPSIINSSSKPKSSPSSRSNSSSSSKPSNDRSPEAKRQQNNLKNWERLYKDVEEQPTQPTARPSQQPTTTVAPSQQAVTITSKWTEEPDELDDSSGSFSEVQQTLYQIHGTYIVSQIKSGFLLIDQQAAHERILYEKYLNLLEEQQAHIQTELFPRTVVLSPSDAELLKDILPNLKQLGLEIQTFGANSFVINGMPAELSATSINEEELIEQLLEQYKQNIKLNIDIRDNLARSMARSAAIKRGSILNNETMQAIIDQLFACRVPFKDPSGRNCFITMNLESLEKQFAAG